MTKCERRTRKRLLTATALALLTGCTTVTGPPEITVLADRVPPLRPPGVAAQQSPSNLSYKRKIAIGRITNETMYGKLLFGDGDTDPTRHKIADMLISRLAASKRFLIFERPDLNPSSITDQARHDAQLAGVDTLIIGSLTEFGRTAQGRRGFLSQTKRQLVKAKVDVRLVDMRTGHVYFSAVGSGQATVETGDIAGFGSRSAYDATLNDRAIGAAISDVVNDLIARLESRPWQTDILQVKGRIIYISGGARQGIHIGDRLSVFRFGERVQSRQMGTEIRLPATEIASIEVESLFGDSELSEGAACRLISGQIGSEADLQEYFVAELKGDSR